MSNMDSTNPTARSWRDIPQEIAPRAMSRVGRRRMTVSTMRNIAWVVAGLVVVTGGWLVWGALSVDPQRMASAAGSRPVKHIVVQTNGVLDQKWVEETLNLPRDIGLMELDLYALRSRLLATGQVSGAILMREFPETLKVVLEERSPVVRLKAQLDGPDVRDFMVARDGTVFTGQNFPSDTVNRLPWLGGVRLLRSESGFAPIEDMDRVADLLGIARGNVPNLFAKWRVVSLERSARDGEIIVQSDDVPEIIFGTREDFYSQVARLDLALDRVRRLARAPLRSINLAIGPEHVPVALAEPLFRVDVEPRSTVRFPKINR